MAAEPTAELGQGGLEVFEAWYGDKSGAIALLEFPTHLRDFFLRLLDKADLPDSPPPGAHWGPFLRGWPEGDFYIVARTSPDLASARPGMVATRMLAFPVAAAKNWGSLGAVFEYLQDMRPTYAAKHTFGYGTSSMAPEVPAALLSCVAHHLIHVPKPVAIIGQPGFGHLIAALWARLPAELRPILRFGFSFTPTDLAVSHAHIVAVPETCQPRWRAYQFQCSASWGQPLSIATAALLSDARAQDLVEFINKVGLPFHSFADYERCARLWDDWQRRSENEPQVVYRLLRGLGTCIPDATQAIEQKLEAMRLAAAWLDRADADAILTQRSVKAGSFPENGRVLGHAVGAWIRKRFSPEPTAADRAASAVRKVVLAVPTAQSPEWQAWVREGLHEALNPLRDASASVVWAIFSDWAAFPEIAAQLARDAVTEHALVRTFPGPLPSDLYPLLEKCCEDRDWISLLATSANARVGLSKAMQLVLNHKVGHARSAAVKLLCGSADPPEVWAAAFQHDDPTLVECAASAASGQPNLWTAPAPNEKRWAFLLEAAAKLDPGFLRKVDVDLMLVQLLEAWQQGAPVSASTLEALERARGLDFSGCSKRENVWPLVPPRFRSRALVDTLRGWLKNFYSQPPKEPILEKELVEILFERDNLGVTFPENSAELARGGLLLLEKWGHDDACQAWLDAVAASNSTLSVELGRRAGSLVSDRGWRSAAALARHYDRSSNRHDLAPVWHTFYESLSSLEKLAFDWGPRFWGTTLGKGTTGRTKPIADAVFITALPEEFSAVRAYLAQRHEQVDRGTVYEVGWFQTEAGNCAVAVVQTGMGNAPSAAATERALTLFEPSFAFFVGIAGALKEDVGIGDVVAADKVYFYEGGKAAATFQPRPEATRVSHEAVQRACAVVRDNNWQKRINPAPSRTPAAVVKPIAAGEKVLVSEASEDLRRLRAIFTDAQAVAMEEHGFAVAVRTHPHVCFAVVRGISDSIENKEHADKRGSHEVAARHAAAFAFEMLAGLMHGRRETSAARPPVID